MTDRVPGAPGQYSAVISENELQKLQSGEQFTITLTRDDKPIVPGTPYSKAAVLPDELAAKICPDMDDPAPKDAFAALYENVAKLQNDYIVAQGTKDGWTFRQWASGLAECWTTITNPKNEQETGMITFPFLFKLEPTLHVTFDMDGVQPPILCVPLYVGYGFHFPEDDHGNAITEDFVISTAYYVKCIQNGSEIYDVPEGVKMNVYVIGSWMGDIPESGGVSYNEVTAKIVDGVLVIR